MALKHYQDRLRKENGKEVVRVKVQGDAKGGGVAEVGRLDFKTSLSFSKALGELNHSQESKTLTFI